MIDKTFAPLLLRRHPRHMVTRCHSGMEVNYNHQTRDPSHWILKWAVTDKWKDNLLMTLGIHLPSEVPILMLLDKVTKTVNLVSEHWEESVRKVFKSRVTQTTGSIKRQLGACYELTCWWSLALSFPLKSQERWGVVMKCKCGPHRSGVYNWTTAATGTGGNTPARASSRSVSSGPSSPHATSTAMDTIHHHFPPVSGTMTKMFHKQKHTVL